MKERFNLLAYRETLYVICPFLYPVIVYAFILYEYLTATGTSGAKINLALA